MLDDHILMVKVTKVSQAMAFMAIKITNFCNTQPLNIIAIACHCLHCLVPNADVGGDGCYDGGGDNGDERA